MNIEYITGDATAPRGEGPGIIAHVCNNRGGWGAGFVLAISRRWTEPEEAYRALARSPEGLVLGQVQLVPVAESLWVVNMVAQVLGDPSGVDLRYPALLECLNKLADLAAERGASVHMPRIGCGLAGGRWEEVEPLIIQSLCARNVPVIVYDLKR